MTPTDRRRNPGLPIEDFSGRRQRVVHGQIGGFEGEVTQRDHDDEEIEDDRCQHAAIEGKLRCGLGTRSQAFEISSKPS